MRDGVFSLVVSHVHGRLHLGAEHHLPFWDLKGGVGEWGWGGG
jgi:hypothetical protein